VKRIPGVCDFTALYEKRGKWIIATVAEVPGVNTQGRTMREARVNLQEALRLVLECNRKLAEETFRPDEIVKERVRVAVGR
jgi:predicted RNase H-like HicB family nuclease